MAGELEDVVRRRSVFFTRLFVFHLSIIRPRLTRQQLVNFSQSKSLVRRHLGSTPRWREGVGGGGGEAFSNPGFQIAKKEGKKKKTDLRRRRTAKVFF